MNQLLTPERRRLIMSITAVLALALIIVVLLFQMLEYKYYRQAPSVWPAAVR